MATAATPTTSVLDYTEDDVRSQLECLGYQNLPSEQIKQFTEDLLHMMKSDRRNKCISDTRQLYRDNTDYSDPDPDPDSYISTPAPSHCDKTDPTQPEVLVDKYRPSLHSSKPPEDNPPYVTSKISHKRKIVRSRAGRRVYEESITETEPDTETDYMCDQLSCLSTTTTTDNVYSNIRPFTSTNNELYTHRPSGDERGVYKPYLPRSFIRPTSSSSISGSGLHQHRKTDPVNRYHHFKTEWDLHKPPGEKLRKHLRWTVREQMLCKTDSTTTTTNTSSSSRPSHRYIANNYIIPTDKKRQSLRWEVRNNIASGLPISNNVQYY